MELQGHKIAILGYGNQGRAQALNLRDSGALVIVGARSGKGAAQAKKDGFTPKSYQEAASLATVVMFLLPDHVIGSVYKDLQEELQGKLVGFSHGFAFHFRELLPLKTCQYFLVGPKGAGAVLRDRYLSKKPLPGVYATVPKSKKLKKFAVDYAKAVGLGSPLVETTFGEETICDLFGEQAVLCGGLMRLMEEAYEALVSRGVNPEMAFFECCYEVKTIADLWIQAGPAAMTEKISPTAFFGGTTRGKRLVTSSTRREMQKILSEIEHGQFSKEWLREVKRGMPILKKERARLKKTSLEKIYQRFKNQLNP